MNVQREHHGYEIESFDLGRWGEIRFAQWLAPLEGRKTFTEAQMDRLARLIKPGAICCDIGAFTGDTAIPMAVCAGSRGHVLAFEPNPASAEVLMINAALNPQIAPILVCGCAIFPETGVQTMTYTGSEFCTGGVASPRTEYELTVRGFRLQTMLPAWVQRTKIGYLKMDTDGSDLSLLRANYQTIQNHRPIIQTELSAWSAEAERADHWCFLSDRLNYFIGDINGEPVSLAQAMERSLEYVYSVPGEDLIDLYCVPREKMENEA